MRKIQQQRLLDSMNTLEKARVEVFRAYTSKGNSGSVDAILQTLVDCDAFADELQLFVVECAGEGTETWGLIEKFRDEITIVHGAISGEDKNASAAVKGLRKFIAKIENSVKNELKPDKIEMVFLPYNASMWDSLESIWKAADADPNCDAYVVPIPYYEYTPDHKFGQMHYDGNEYPDYVPVVDWKSYDLELRHPDVIWIHNPYDEVNNVTSVHPDFYSSSIRGFTDKLCYVPYYVVSGDETGEHFCVNAGTIYSNHTFVQSEGLRQCFLKYYKKWEKDNNCVGRFGKADDKFIALGSPMFDAIINAKAEDFTLPGSWRKLIYREDGTKKKVIMYNFRLTDMTAGVENQIKKMQSVLETFYERRDDVVLWFRPHPLNEQCLRAMRPWVYELYDKIITAYKTDGFGVFDDTSELHRAVCLCDAYYGDVSAVTALFGRVSKNIMYSELGDWYTPLFAANGAIDGDILYGISLRENAFVKFDIKSVEICYCEKADPECNSRFSHTGGCKVGDYVYFAPHTSENLLCYDIKSGELNRIRIPIKKQGVAFCQNVVLCDKILVLMGYGFPGILLYDTIRGKFEVVDNFASDLLRIIGDKNPPYYFYTEVIAENKVYAVIKSSPLIFEFDVNTRTSRLVDIQNEPCDYSAIGFDGEYIWLAGCFTATKKVFIKKWKEGEAPFSIEMPVDYIDTDYPISKFLFSGRFAWAIPCCGNKILKIDMTNNVVVCDDYFSEYVTANRITTSANKFTSAHIWRGKVFLAPTERNEIFFIDVETDEREREIIKVAHNSSVDAFIVDKPLHESRLFGLYEFCSAVASDLFSKKSEKHEVIEGGQAGARIFDFVKTDLA